MSDPIKYAEPKEITQLDFTELDGSELKRDLRQNAIFRASLEMLYQALRGFESLGVAVKVTPK